MREELRIAIEDIIRNGFIYGISSYVTSNKIADLVDQDQKETRIEDSYDSVFASFDKLDQALDEHFAMLDKIKEALSPTPKAEEVIHGE